MKDKISRDRIALLHPKLRDEAERIITEAESKLPDNYTVRVTYTLRTFEEQNALYAQGRTKPGKIITKAKAGQSYHNYSLALDFVILVDGVASWKVDKNWLTVIEQFEKYGWEAGHRWKFKDSPHVQKVFGYTWKQLLAKYKPGEYVSI